MKHILEFQDALQLLFRTALISRRRRGAWHAACSSQNFDSPVLVCLATSPHMLGRSNWYLLNMGQDCCRVILLPGSPSAVLRVRGRDQH